MLQYPMVAQPFILGDTLRLPIIGAAYAPVGWPLPPAATQQNFTGTSGDDNLVGTADADVFRLKQGGNDTASGLAGDDYFVMGGSLTPDDHIDGGGGAFEFDVLLLKGDYSAGLTLAPTTIQNISMVVLQGGVQNHSYTITLDEGNVAAGGFMSLIMDGGGGTLMLDGSADTDGGITVQGGEAADTILTTAQDDFAYGEGGDDTIHTGARNDYLRGGDGSDVLDGGDGFDRAAYYKGATGVHVSLLLQGVAQDTGSGFDTLSNIEALSGTFYDDTLIGDDGDNWLWGLNQVTFFDIVANNETLIGGGGDDLLEAGSGDNVLDGGAGIDTVLLNWTLGKVTVSLALQGAAQDTGQGLMTLSGIENLSGSDNIKERFTGDDGNNILAGGHQNDVLLGRDGSDTLAGDGYFGGSFDENSHNPGPVEFFPVGFSAWRDVLRGGDGDDILIGGGGRDFIIGGRGADTIVFTAAAESTGPIFDTVIRFKMGTDHFDVVSDVAAIDSHIESGSLSNATFDDDLELSVNAAALDAGNAVLFTPDSGDHGGRLFLVIDQNGSAGYQAGEDLVVELVTPVDLANIDAGDFI